MIHEISTTEFIAAVTDGSYNENDVQRYCNTQPSLMPLFKSLLKAASALFASKGIQGGYIWNLTERRWEFNNVKDMRIYADVEFVRLQNAMCIVCDLIEKQPLQEQTEPNLTPDERAEKIIPKWNDAKIYFVKAVEVGLMNSSYQWAKGLQLLACFVRELSLKLDIGKGYGSNGQKRIKWRPFEDFFNIDKGRLRLNFNDIQKTGQEPSEIGLIDNVFE